MKKAMEFFMNWNIKFGSENTSLLGGHLADVSDVIAQSDTKTTINRIILCLTINLRSYSVHAIELDSSCT